MTTVQRVAQIVGWISIIIGVLALFITGFDMEADNALAPRLFGLFPMNFLHALVHLGVGIWGVLAAREWTSSKSFCQIAGVAFLALTLLGFITPRLFGLMPIGSNNIWLHALYGIVLAYFGFTARERPAERAGT